MAVRIAIGLLLAVAAVLPVVMGLGAGGFVALAEVLGTAHAPRLRHFVRQHAAPGARLHSDGHGAYLPLDHEHDHNTVSPSAGA